MRKVLILTRNFPPYVTGSASRVWKFASNFTTIGWEPVVVAPPAIAGMAGGVKSGANPVNEVCRIAPDLDAGELDAAGRCALLHGQEVPGTTGLFKGRQAKSFKSATDGELWLKNATATVERLLEEDQEIELLYAQGPPLEPLWLAFDIARKHSLNIMLDITEPLDPSMPRPGASRSSAAAKAEEQVMLSGVPILTPNRLLKEYFLKKYHGKLDNNLVTIVPPAFDPSHPAFRRQEPNRSGTVLRIALLVADLPVANLKALVSGLEAWIQADGIIAGGIEIVLLGDGVPELLRRTAKNGSGNSSPLMQPAESTVSWRSAGRQRFSVPCWGTPRPAQALCRIAWSTRLAWACPCASSRPMAKRRGWCSMPAACLRPPETQKRSWSCSVRWLLPGRSGTCTARLTGSGRSTPSAPSCTS